MIKKLEKAIATGDWNLVCEAASMMSGKKYKSPMASKGKSSPALSKLNDLLSSNPELIETFASMLIEKISDQIGKTEALPTPQENETSPENDFVTEGDFNVTDESTGNELDIKGDLGQKGAESHQNNGGIVRIGKQKINNTAPINGKKVQTVKRSLSATEKATAARMKRKKEVKKGSLPKVRKNAASTFNCKCPTCDKSWKSSIEPAGETIPDTNIIEAICPTCTKKAIQGGE